MQIGVALTPVSVSGTSAQSAAISGGSGPYELIRLVSTTNCHVEFGTNPTATTNSAYLPAGVVEYFKVNTGEKVAAIQNSSSGTLHIARMV